jgi:hypothetical protein
MFLQYVAISIHDSLIDIMSVDMYTNNRCMSIPRRSISKIKMFSPGRGKDFPLAIHNKGVLIDNKSTKTVYHEKLQSEGTA